MDVIERPDTPETLLPHADEAPEAKEPAKEETMAAAPLAADTPLLGEHAMAPMPMAAPADTPQPQPEPEADAPQGRPGSRSRDV